jgi:hypothetical protein
MREVFRVNPGNSYQKKENSDSDREKAQKSHKGGFSSAVLGAPGDWQHLGVGAPSALPKLAVGLRCRAALIKPQHGRTSRSVKAQSQPVKVNQGVFSPAERNSVEP